MPVTTPYGINILNDVLIRARSLLNDDEGTNWPDFRLITKAQQAFEELEAELYLAGIPIINQQNVIMLIPAYNISANDGFPLDMSTLPGYPKDMIMPIWCKERWPGQEWRDFVDMVETDFPPVTTTDVYLRYWNWTGGKIFLMGALNDVQLLLRYQRFLPLPGINTDSISVPLGQLHLCFRTASLAAASIPGQQQVAADFDNRATVNLDKIVRMNIKQQQNLPTKRRPYHRGSGRNRVLRDF